MWLRFARFDRSKHDILVATAIRTHRKKHLLRGRQTT